jgi:REP element-mobilizing transposase RayT
MSTKYKFLDPEGIYFISFSTVGWVDIFTRPEYKNIFVDSVQYCQQRKGLILHAWCLMTNHVHLIFSSAEKGKQSEILRDLKKFTSNQIIKAIRSNPLESRKEWILEIFKKAGIRNCNNQNFQFWQQDNHPIEIYSPRIISQKIEYIHDNPVKSGFVIEAEHYLYSSARNYAGQKGILEVEILDVSPSLVGYVHVGR